MVMKFLLKPIYSPLEMAAITVFFAIAPNTWWAWAALVAFFLCSSAAEMWDPRQP